MHPGVLYISRCIAPVLLTLTAAFWPAVLPTSAESVSASQKTQQARMKRDYRLFFGLDDPINDTPAQIERLHRMCAELKKSIMDQFECGNMDLSDPTSAGGGAALHSVAAL